jgi:hypothetical protein
MIPGFGKSWDIAHRLRAVWKGNSSGMAGAMLLPSE